MEAVTEILRKKPIIEHVGFEMVTFDVMENTGEICG